MNCWVQESHFNMFGKPWDVQFTTITTKLPYYYTPDSDFLCSWTLFTMAVNSMSWSLQKSSKRQKRRVIRNFSGHWNFVRTWTPQQTIIYNTKKKDPAGKSLPFFLLETHKNLPMDDHNQDFFQKLGHFFPISEKAQGRPPSPPPSSYAPAKYASDNYKTLPNLFLIKLQACRGVSIKMDSFAGIVQVFFVLFKNTHSVKYHLVTALILC